MFEDDFGGLTNRNALGSVEAQLKPIGTAAKPETQDAGDAPLPLPRIDAIKPAPGDTPAPEGNLYSDEERKRVKDKYGENWGKMSWFDQQRALAHDRWFRDVDSGAIDTDTFLEGVFNDPEVERINKREQEFISALKNAMIQDVTRLSDDEAQGYYMDLVAADPRFGFKDDVDGKMLFGDEAQYGRANLKRLLSVYSGANPNGLYSREAQKWLESDEAQRIASAKEMRGVKDKVLGFFDTDAEIVASAEQKLMAKERAVQFASLMGGLSPAGQELVKEAIKADELDERTLRFLDEDERDAAMAAFRVSKADLDANWWLTQGAARFGETAASVVRGTWRTLANIYLTTGGRNPVGSKQLAAYEKEQELQLKIEDAEKWKYKDNLTFAGDIAAGLMGTIPYMAAMSNPYTGTMATLGMANDARERMILSGVDQDTALAISLPVGIVEGWIEKIQWEGAFGGSLSEFALRRASLLGVMKQIGKSPAKYLGGKLLKSGKETAIVSITEDVEEVLQQLTEDLGVSVGTGDFNVREIAEDCWDTAVESFPTTLGFGLMRASGVGPALHRKFSRKSVASDEFIDYAQSKVSAMNVMDDLANGRTMSGQNGTQKPVVTAKVDPNGPDFPGGTAQDAPEAASTPSGEQTGKETSPTQEAPQESQDTLKERLLDDFRTRWHRIDDADGRIGMLQDSGLNTDQAAILDTFFRLEDDFLEDNPVYRYYDANGDLKNMISIENLPKMMKGIKKVSLNEDGSHTLDLQLDKDTVVPVKIERVDRSTLRKENEAQYEKEVRIHYEDEHGKGSWDKLDDDAKDVLLRDAAPGGFTRITVDDETMPYDAIIKLAAPRLRQDLGNGVVIKGDPGADIDEVGHEIFHAAVRIALKRGIITEEDIGKMRQAFGAAKAEGYLFDEEKAADEYGRYIVDEYWKDETIGSVFGKIRDFFRRIYNALFRKSGNEPAELNAANVFEAISRGDLRGISALSGITVNEESATQEAEAETPAESSTGNKPTVTAEVKDAVTVEATVEEVPVENLSTKNDPDFDPELAEAAPALVNSEPGDGMPVVVGGGNVLSGSETVQAAKRAGKKSVKVKRVRKVKTAKKPAAKVVKPFDIFNPQESLAAMNPFARNKFLSVQRFCDIHGGSFPCLQYWLDNGHAMFGRPAKDAKINDYLDQLSMSDRLFLTGMRKGWTSWDELPSLIGLDDKTTEDICDQALQERAHYIAWKERGGLTPEAEEFLANGGTEEEWIAANTRDETAEAPVAQEEPTEEEKAELYEVGYYSIRDAVELLNDLVEADFIFGGANGIMSANETVENTTDKVPSKTIRPAEVVVDGYGVPNADRHRAYLSDCLSRMGDAAHGANVDRGGQISPATVRQVFTDFNSNAETAAIFEEVAKVADALKVEYFLDRSEDNNLGDEYGYQYGGSVYYHLDRLAPESDQFIADTILHEMIHGVTAYAIDLAHGIKDLPGVTVSDELKAAVKDLDALYDRNRKRIKREIGAENEHEFIAELSSADFRRKLAERSDLRRIFERIIDAIRRMFNLAPIDRTDYAVQAVNVLDRFLTNYQEEKFAQYQERAWDLEFGERQENAHMKKSAERVKDLLAVHNMNEDAVKPTADLGGFAIPSIAIFKNTYGHNEFGEVTVLFGKETIDPRKNRLNRVYSHDAWTATFPAISNKIDQQAIERKNEELIATLDERLTQPLYNAIYYLRNDDGVRDSWDRATDAGDAYGRNDALKAAYLVSRGEKVEPVYKDKTYIRGGHQRVYMLHEDGLRSLYESPVGRKLIDIYLGPGAESTAKYEKIAPKLEQFFRDIIWKRDFAGKPDVEGYTQEDVVGHFFTGEDGLNLGEMVSIAEALVRLEDDIKGGKVGMQEIDEYKTRDAISGRVADNDPGFVAWLNEQYGNPILGKGVYNGAERFTRMGNRRSWDALHDPATLENIVRAMKKTQKENGNGIFGSNPFGVAARTLRSMQDIFATENILKELTPEEEKAIKAELSNRLSDIVGRYGKTQKSPDENPFIAADRAADMMFDAYQKYRQSIAGLKRELNGWGYSADDQLVQDFADLMAAIEMMPTNYFEAKPQRPVRFDEPKAWIVPHDAKPETLKTLRGNGQRIYTYRRGDNADRLRVVNDAANDTDALFSVRNPGGAQKRSDLSYPDATPEISNIPDGLFSIGNRKREEFKNLIVRKRPDFKDPDRAVEEIGKFATPKEQKAALKWLIGGRLILPEDAPKVTEAIRYAEKAKKDPLQYDGPVELMNALAEFKPKDKPIDPDTVPQLSDKRVLPDGVVTYAVQDDRAGQQAMREIVNTHWGKNANPWCLLHGDGEGNLSDGSDGGYNAWEYWNHYNALPKRVAFRNGKLLAFMATETPFENIYGDSYLKDHFSRSSSYPKWIKDYYAHETRYNGFEDYMWKKHPDEMRNEGFRVPEKWWDRNDEDHPGIPLGNQAVPNDPLGRFADFIIDKDGKRQVEGGYHKNDENVEIYWNENGVIDSYRDKKTDFRVRFKNGNVKSVTFREGSEFNEFFTFSAVFGGDGTDTIDTINMGGTVTFGNDGSFSYRADFSDYTFLCFNPDGTLDKTAENSWTEVWDANFEKKVDIETAAKRISKGVAKRVEQAKAAYQEALAVRDRYTVPVLASPTAVTPSEGLFSIDSGRTKRLAPNGKRSNLTDRQYDQVRTPEFKAWFGDWENDPANASKVVDENGEPMVVYRGDTHNENEFFFGYNEDGWLVRNWFTTSKEVADYYSQEKFGEGGATRAFFLNIRNPASYDAQGKRYDNLNYKGENVSNGVVDMLQSDSDEKSHKQGSPRADGIVLRNIVETDEIDVVADDWLIDDRLEDAPSRIKSATDNTGAFDPGSQDIRYSVRFDRKDPTDIIAGIVAMKTRKGEKMTINAVQKLLASVGADPSVGADLILRGQKSANRIENIVKGKALDDDTFLELATDESKKSRLLSFGEKMGMEGYKLGAADEQNLAALNEAKAAAVTAAMESAAGFSANAMELKYGFNLVDSVKNAHHAQVIKAKKPQGKQDQPGEVNGEGITLTEMVAQEEANAAKPEQVAAPESAAMKELKAKAAKRADKIDAKFGLTGLNGMSPAQVADAKYQEQLDEYRRQHPEEDAGGGEGEGAPVKKSQVKREQLDFNRASDFIAFVEEVVARESGKDGLFVKKNGAYQCSPLDVRNLANTAKFFLKEVASRLLYSKDRELIMRDLDELHKATTLRGVESAVMNLYTRIQDRLIPESQEQLIHKLEWAGKQLAEQGPVLSRGGDERDRKVRAKVEEWWRMVKAYLRFKPEEVEEEKNRLDKIIENREDVAAKDKAAGGADFIEQDLKYRQAIALKNALTQYGGLINRTPGEIADKSEEILAQLRGSRLELENAREDEYIRTRTISSHLQQAVINPKALKDNKKPNPNWFVRMMDSMMGILYLRLRDLIRYSHGDVRRRAEADLRDIEDAVALGSQDFNVYLVTHQRKFDEAMKHIYGSSEKGVIRLTEPLDDADRKVLTKQGINRMTRSWLLQRFVELQQTDDYAQNIAVNKRDGKWREDFDRIFKKYISEEDMTFLMWMRNWYRENLAELNEKVLVPITGIKQYSPGENYFPVKMLPPPRLGVDTQAKAWSPLPSWLTPRVPNNRDFDERTDLLTMWYNRMRESGASIAYARLGLNLSDILLNPAMKEAVSRNHGDVALTRLQEHIRDIISGGARPIDESDDSLALADRLRAWQTNFTLSGNYISSLKQTTSCPTFALRHDIDFRMVFNFMMDVDFGSVKELMASDGWKSRYGNGLSEAMQNAMRVNSSISTGRAAKAVNLLHRVYNSGFKVAEVGDAFPCLWVGQGLYRYFLAQIRDQEGGSAVMSEEEMKRKALTRTWAVIETNQQSKRTENLTAAQRGGPLGRFLYQFVSSPVQQMAFEVQAIREALAARGTDHQAEAYRHLGRVLVINHILTPGLLRVAAIVGGLPLGQIPNRDDLFWDFIIQMLMGQYGCIFLAGQIGEGTLRALTTGKFDYRSQGLPVEGIADLFQKLGVTGFDLVTWRYEELLDDLLGVMKSTGAPTRHISNSIDNWGRGKIERNLRTWR